MSNINLHTLIILPGGTVKYFCEDGLSALSVMHIKQILNFSGKLVAVNCGAGNEWVALGQAYYDMWILYMRATTGSNEQKDYELAYKENLADFEKFKASDVYKAWYGDDAQVYKRMMQAKAKVWCGHEIDMHNYIY